MNREQAIELMKSGRCDEALGYFQKAIESDPYDWLALYMAGQCCRFTNKLKEAISYFNKSINIKNDEPAVYSELGIVLQLNEEFQEATKALQKAIQIDFDYAYAYNSLALTQKKMGHLEAAINTYEAGIEALSRQIVKSMQNDFSNPIIQEIDTPQFLWSKYAMYGAMFLGSHEDIIKRIAWPTAEQAMEERTTERHGGLYWVDYDNSGDGIIRLFLPNYFSTFLVTLLHDKFYSTLIGNRGTVLALAGHSEDAKKHFEEATYFNSTTIEE